MAFAAFFFVAFAVIEKLAKGYEWPPEPFWILRGVVWFAAATTVGHYTSMGAIQLIGPYALLDLHFMGLWAVLPALFVYELLTYGLHRAFHASPRLWLIHQLHHSSERIDVWSTWRTHPFEIVGYSLGSVLISVGLLGVSGQAAFVVSIILLIVGHLQRSNLKTPRWLGYFVARPENHMLHHKRDAHSTNYSDFPLIDWMFGTFELPEKAPVEVGFWNGASRRVVEMLSFRDGTVAVHTEDIE